MPETSHAAPIPLTTPPPAVSDIFETSLYVKDLPKCLIAACRSSVISVKLP